MIKIFTGKVVSTKMAKTATVSVDRVIIHPKYGKRYKRDRKFQVHDEIGVKVGEVVKFVACKPYSKTKKWIILTDTKVEKVSKVLKVSKVVATKTKKEAKK